MEFLSALVKWSGLECGVVLAFASLICVAHGCFIDGRLVTVLTDIMVVLSSSTHCNDVFGISNALDGIAFPSLRDPIVSTAVFSVSASEAGRCGAMTEVDEPLAARWRTRRQHHKERLTRRWSRTERWDRRIQHHRVRRRARHSLMSPNALRVLPLHHHISRGSNRKT